jgi:glutaredoxin
MKQNQLHRRILLLIFCICATAILLSLSIPTGAAKEIAAVRIDSLDVHAKASTDSRIVKTLSKGDAVSVAYELIGMEGAWCALAEESESSVVGYVQCKLLERKTSSKTYQSIGPQTVAAAPATTPEEDAVAPPTKTIRPASDVKALLYLAEWCPYCRKARECLKSLGVNLIEYDIEKDDAKDQEMMDKGGTGSVPFIDIEGSIIRGYNEEAIKRAVARRRGL